MVGLKELVEAIALLRFGTRVNVVLMIVRLDDADQLEGSVTVFLPGHQMFKGTLIQEQIA